MKVVIIALALISLSLAGHAQGNRTEVIRRPDHAKQLEGYVSVVGSGEHISGVLVEECDGNWKRVLNSTTTDENGHFHLKSAAAGSKHYLRLTAKNYNLRFYTVILSSHSPSQLNLAIAPGT